MLARLVAFIAVLAAGSAPAIAQERAVSDYTRDSRYVTVRDGTRLAVNIYRPAVDGRPVAEPAPVVVAHAQVMRRTAAPGGRP